MITEKGHFLKTVVNKPLLLLSALMAIVYFLVILGYFARGNPVLFWLLIVGELFHLWQVSTYIYTVWNTEYQRPFDPEFMPAVDVFITVAGEPKDIVEETVRAAKAMNYPNFKVYILNDGKVAKKENWREMEVLAKKLKIGCITRTIPGGAKAGNINHGMSKTHAPFVVIFDADHVPYPHFLGQMMGYFTDSKVAFVQSPQYYYNHGLNLITGSAWEQQELFFGALCKGKNRLNAVFMCGTNMVLRRSVILEVGGMCETNIAEDFLTSLFVHEKGYKSVYVPEILAEGLAPEDFLSYYKQQFRWARGSLEVIFKYNPFLRKGLSWPQKIQYLSSSSYYLSGGVVLLNALMPLIFFFTGLVPFQISTMNLAAVFLPYIFLNLYVLYISSGLSFTFRALAFSVSSFILQLQAIFGVLTNQKTSFAVTSKTAVAGNFLRLVIPHITYICLVVIGLIYSIYREGVSASVVTNFAWAVLNVAVFSIFIVAASPKGQLVGGLEEGLANVPHA